MRKNKQNYLNYFKEIIDFGYAYLRLLQLPLYSYRFNPTVF